MLKKNILLDLPVEILLHVVHIMENPLYAVILSQLNKFMKQQMESSVANHFWKIRLQKDYLYREINDSDYVNYKELYQFYSIKRKECAVAQKLTAEQKLLFNFIRNDDLQGIKSLKLKAEDYFGIYEDTVKSPILVASQNQKINILKYFLEEAREQIFSGFEKDHLRRNLAHWAAACGDLSEIKKASYDSLIELDDTLRTPFYLAAEMGHSEIVKWYINEFKLRGLDKLDLYAPPISQAAQNGHVEVVKLLINYEPESIQRRNDKHTLAIHLAAHNGDTRILQLLTANNAKVNVFSHNNATPLWLAVAAGNYEATKFLIKNNADIDAADSENITPLFLAARLGFVEITNLLIAHGANANAICTPHKITPLYAASISGKLEVVRILIKAVEEINSLTNEERISLLSVSAHNGHAKIVEFLLEHYAKIDPYSNYNKQEIFHAAMKQGHVDVMKVFLKNGVKVNELYNKFTHLSLAAAKNCLSVVKFLIDAGAKINLPNECGSTALQMAIVSGKADVVQFLISRGADVDVDYKGVSPLAFALYEGHVEIVKILLKAKAKLDSKINFSRGKASLPQISTLLTLWQTKEYYNSKPLIEQIKHLLTAPLQDKNTGLLQGNFFSKDSLVLLRELNKLNATAGKEEIIPLLVTNLLHINSDRYDFIFEFIFTRDDEANVAKLSSLSHCSEFESLMGTSNEEAPPDFCEEFFKEFDNNEPDTKRRRLEAPTNDNRI